MPYPNGQIRKGGAPAYYSPEVATARPDRRVVVNYSKSDDWAVGMIAFQLLCGSEQWPFDGAGPEAYNDDNWRPIDPARTAGYRNAAACRRIVRGLLQGGGVGPCQGGGQGS